jgi:hypothetical protein
MTLIIESKRDQRVLDWLVSQVGEKAVCDACEQLIGARRAYVSNIAKILNLCPPPDLVMTSREDAKHHLEAIHRLLGTRQYRDQDHGPA